MSDKPLFEFKMVKTDGGFRFEVNADKDRLHELAEYKLRRQQMKHEWNTWSRWERRFWRHGWCFGPWWDEEPEPKEKPESPSPATDSTPNDAPATA